MVPDRRRATPILRLLPSNETRLARGQGNCQELGTGSMGQSGKWRTRTCCLPGGKSRTCSSADGWSTAFDRGQIRCLELLGRGFEEVNRHAEAMRFFDRAIRLADGDKDSGLPFMAYEGKAQALVALGKPNDAKAVIGDAFVKARAQQKRGHEAELLIRLGTVADSTGDTTQAIQARIRKSKQQSRWRKPCDTGTSNRADSRIYFFVVDPGRQPFRLPGAESGARFRSSLDSPCISSTITANRRLRVSTLTPARVI